MKRAVQFVAAVAMAGTLGACGLSDPYAGDSTPTTGTTQIVDNEVRPTSPYRDARDPAAVQPTPERAAASFAELYINWTYATLADTRRKLAEIAVGEAAAAQQRAAAETARDYELRRGKVENRGEVVSVARQNGAPGGRFVVVTRETTLGAGTYEGLPPAYHVTLVTIVAVDGGYAVRSWQPQS